MVCECGAPIHVCLVEEPLGKRVERGERERRAARNKNKNKISDESRGTRDEVRGAVRAALSHMQNYSKTTPRTPQPHLDFRISASHTDTRVAAPLRTACAPPAHRLSASAHRARLCAPLRTPPSRVEKLQKIIGSPRDVHEYFKSGSPHLLPSTISAQQRLPLCPHPGFF